jgi:hypothetical protein
MPEGTDQTMPETTTRVCTSDTCKERLTEHRLILPERAAPGEHGVWECSKCGRREPASAASAAAAPPVHNVEGG